VPIVALSSHAFEGDRERALAAGCDDYIAKPIDEGELFDKIALHLAASGARPGSAP
jgi:CheY-like chemotaxis protein